MDGPAEITQDPIEPGKSYTYEFTTRQYGTYFYHSHDHPDRQQALGLYGALIIDSADPAVDATYEYDHELVVQLQEWLERDGYTYPAMPMEGLRCSPLSKNARFQALIRGCDDWNARPTVLLLCPAVPGVAGRHRCEPDNSTVELYDQSNYPIFGAGREE